MQNKEETSILLLKNYHVTNSVNRPHDMCCHSHPDTQDTRVTQANNYSSNLAQDHWEVGDAGSSLSPLTPGSLASSLTFHLHLHGTSFQSMPHSFTSTADCTLNISQCLEDTCTPSYHTQGHISSNLNSHSLIVTYSYVMQNPAIIHLYLPVFPSLLPPTCM